MSVLLGFTLLSAFLVAAPAVAAPEALAGDSPWPETVTADPLPTVQIDGVAWTQEAVGNRVYVGGEFTNARPAGAALGTNQTPRQNALAYNLQTGVLDTSWNPSPNARILSIAVSPDKTRIYVVGQFTSIAGATRNRIAAFNAQTGALITSWAPSANGQVIDVVATNSTVYVVGGFSAINGTSRPRVAAISASTGALLTNFDPIVEGGNGTRAVVVSPDGSKVVVAGSFTSTNGSTGVEQGRGIVALDATNGDLLQWRMANVLHNGGTQAAMYSLASDGDSVYGTGYDFGGSNVIDRFEGAFRADWSDGTLRWMEDCHGDTYGAFPFRGALYVATHAHYCGNIPDGFPQENPWYFNHSLAFAKEPSGGTITPDQHGYRSFTGQPAGKLLHWYPKWGVGTYTGSNQAAWDVAASGDDYLLYAGEFRNVAGVAQQGLVRFAMADIAPNNIGPSIRGGNYQITASSFLAGLARVTWPANHDADDAELTYELLRQGTTTPLHTTTAKSTYWVRPMMSYVDTTVNPGQTYNYRVRVTDADGNTTVSNWTPVTVASGGTATPYNLALLDSGAVNYWPLNEPSGTGAFDWVAGNDIALSASGITRGTTGPSGSFGTRFSGASGISGSSTVAVPGPQVFSVEAWFKTTSTSGGKIVGFGNAQTGQSSSYDRHIYLANNGRITFGVYPGETRTLSSDTGYNNGQWHHVVGTLGAGGMTLYVDGRRVGFRSDTTSAQGYNGYWRVGGDNHGGWPNAGSSNYLNGEISDVAVYDAALTREQVNANWVASGRESVLPVPPADAYGQAVYSLQPNLYWRFGEASGTTAVDSGTDLSNGTYQGGAVQLNQAGALKNVANTAVSFNQPGSDSFVSSDNSYSNPTVYSLETWFKTTSTAGGNIVGFGISRTGTSSNHDRHIYMSADGRVKFGVWTGTQMVVESDPGYNDGAWHHVVAAQSSAGQRLYVDGVLVGSNSNAGAENYTGYWRVGGDTAWEGSTWWQGTVDEFAVYGQPLTQEQVQNHYSLGKDGKINVWPTAGFTFSPTDLSVAFDASVLSSDPDGTIEQYAWDFGDGTTDTTTGATVTHPYSATGTYTVTVTVTDDSGATATFSAPVSVLAPNVPPTAVFTVNSDDAPTVHLDASLSTDSDGTIESYNWDFGNGQTGTGQTVSYTYPQSGDYTITLTVTDNRSGTAVATQPVSVVVPNTPPVAAFTHTLAGLTVTFDGSSSSDANGDTLSYSWSFGDGQTDTTSGATVSHTYVVSETTTFGVTLTVSDGADSNSVTIPVTVTPPPTEDVIAQDAFGRSVTNAWGNADLGGVWTVSSAPSFSVTDGQGKVTVARGATRSAVLNGVSGTEAVVGLQLASDVAAAGSTTSVTVIGRQVGSALYGARVRFETNGTVRLMLMRIDGGETALGGSLVLPGNYTAGDVINVQLSVTGTSPTTIAGKAWFAGDPEPAGWLREVTDTAANLQAAGVVGIRSAVSSSSTVPITVLSYDNFRVTTGLAPVPNNPPVAAFSSQVNGLTVNFDAGASSDADGDTLSYSWNFGNGSTGSGRTPSHTYSVTQETTFQVTLTVSDGEDSASVTHPVTVAPAPNQAPVAAFSWNASGLTVAFDGGGSSDPDGDDLTFAWQYGDGQTGTGQAPTHTYLAAGTRTVTLTVSDGEASSSVSHQIVVTEVVPPTEDVVAEDTFGRTATNSWGVADTGGAWTLSGANPAYSVADGKGVVVVPAGGTREARLTGVTGVVSNVQVQLTADPVPGAGTSSVTVIGRQVGSESYSARVRFEAGGAVRLMLLRISGGETALGGSVLLPGSYEAGEVINLKLSVIGVSPTVIAAKAWYQGDPEPAGWMREATDLTGSLQAAGSVAIRSSVSAANTAPSTRFTYDNYKVVR